MSVAKGIKTIVITAQATNSHNSVKVKNVLRWLKSGHEIRVKITGKADRQKAMESMYKQMEKDINQGARFLQKVVKPDTIKFTLQPTKDAENIVIDDSNSLDADDQSYDSVDEKQNIFSDEFEEELEKSIQEEKTKHKKKK